MMWNHDQYVVGWPAMVFFMLAVWALAGASFYLVARWLGRASRTTDALSILDERVARGEIDVEEYTRVWQAIGERRPALPHR